MAKKKACAARISVLPKEKQPFKIPNNWFWTDIASINGYSGTAVDPMKFPETIYELYSIPSSANDFPEIISGSEIGSSKQSVIKNDVLLCKINPRINRVWKVSQHTENELLASSEWIVIRNQILNSDYMMFCFRTQFFREYMLSNVSGVGGSLMRAQPKFVKNYPIPIAPVAEQQRIVDRIESIFAKLDEAKEKAQAVVDGFELRKSAILHKAFTGELTEKWREKHEIKIDDWKKYKIDECCKVGSGGTPSRKRPEYYEGSIPWIKTGEIDWNDILDAEEKISDAAVQDSSAKIYEPGVVLVAMYGMGVTRGKAAILRVQAATNQAVCVLQPKNDLLNRYLFYYFMYNYWNIREKSVGGNQLNLSATIIKNFDILIPSIDEQFEIIRILDGLLAKEKAAKEAAESVLDQIDTMKKAVLARAFRGELGTNDPAEESAVELLKSML